MTAFAFTARYIHIHRHIHKCAIVFAMEAFNLFYIVSMDEVLVHAQEYGIVCKGIWSKYAKEYGVSMQRNNYGVSLQRSRDYVLLLFTG